MLVSLQRPTPESSTPLTQHWVLVRPEAFPDLAQLVPPHWLHPRGQLPHVGTRGGEGKSTQTGGTILSTSQWARTQTVGTT